MIEIFKVILKKFLSNKEEIIDDLLTKYKKFSQSKDIQIDISKLEEKIKEVENKKEKLLELTISEKLPSEFKHKYFKSLSRLVKTLKSYEIKRSLSCDDFETEQICKDILRIVK